MKQKKAVKKTDAPADDPRLPMGRSNYVWMAVGFGAIVLGLILMTGGWSGDPDEFDPDALFSFRRITLATVLVLAGFATEVYAIMHRPKKGGR